MDNDEFGNWISGFVDGEGCFVVRLIRYKDSCVDSYRYKAEFEIHVRADDLAAIEDIKAYWGCGIIYTDPERNGHGRRAKPSLRYRVCRMQDIHNVLIPHFERYVLRSKKRRDFEIFKAAIALKRRMKRGYRWPQHEHDQFAELADRIKSTRKYSDPHSMELFPGFVRRKSAG